MGRGVTGPPGGEFKTRAGRSTGGRGGLSSCGAGFGVRREGGADHQVRRASLRVAALLGAREDMFHFGLPCAAGTTAIFPTLPPT